MLLKIHGKPGSASMTKEKKTHYVCLPDVFGMIKMKYTVLPLVLIPAQFQMKIASVTKNYVKLIIQMNHGSYSKDAGTPSTRPV